MYKLRMTAPRYDNRDAVIGTRALDFDERRFETPQLADYFAQQINNEMAEAGGSECDVSVVDCATGERVVLVCALPFARIEFDDDIPF